MCDTERYENKLNEIKEKVVDYEDQYARLDESEHKLIKVQKGLRKLRKEVDSLINVLEVEHFLLYGSQGALDVEYSN